MVTPPANVAAAIAAINQNPYTQGMLWGYSDLKNSPMATIVQNWVQAYHLQPLPKQQSVLAQLHANQLAIPSFLSYAPVIDSWYSSINCQSAAIYQESGMLMQQFIHDFFAAIGEVDSVSAGSAIVSTSGSVSTSLTSTPLIAIVGVVVLGLFLVMKD
jgi:hypothetical protein